MKPQGSGGKYDYQNGQNGSNLSPGHEITPHYFFWNCFKKKSVNAFTSSSWET